MNQLGSANQRMTPTDVGRMVFRQALADFGYNQPVVKLSGLGRPHHVVAHLQLGGGKKHFTLLLLLNHVFRLVQFQS